MKTLEVFGDVLATREMSWQDADGNSYVGYVDVSIPYENTSNNNNNATDYYCNVRLRDLGDESIERATGVDELQAIFLGLVLAGSKVSTCGLADELDWSDVHNFGFPVPPPLPEGEGGCGC